jgi:homocysteine S-methyltransferase
MRLTDYLAENRIITDGAMGTYYDLISGRCDMAEEANLIEPEVILRIHMEYIKAGARLLRTNTFAVNRHFFESEQEVRKNIAAAFHIAHQAVEECRRQGVLLADEEVYIAADMGPISEENFTENVDILQEYRFLVDCFLEEKPDVFLFETLSEWRYLKEISAYIKSRCDAYVIAQFCFDRSGFTKSGLGLNSMLKEVGEILTLDAYGFNCGMASSHMYHFLKDVSFAADKQITALPNSSYPDVVRGKVIYSGHRTYFVDMMEAMDSLGIRILGGCCGTTPDHIRKLSQRLKDKPVCEKRVMHRLDVAQGQSEETDNYIMDRIRSKKKVIMVELDPPFDGDYRKVVEGAKYLKGKGTDIITLSDSPLARTRMDAGLLAARVIAETGIRVMPHIACRDRNKIALRGLVMGMHANGIRNLLLVTGDPVTAGDNVKSVYEFNSIRLMEYVENINDEMFSNDRMYFGGALNYHGVNENAIAERMKKKMQAGAKYFLTQPVYSDEDIARMKSLKEKTGAVLIVGIMPLVSRKNAIFIKNEMTGINVPEEIISLYREGLSREEYENIAVDVSRQIIEKLGDVADGYYFMTPFNRYGLIQKIIDGTV